MKLSKFLNEQKWQKEPATVTKTNSATAVFVCVCVCVCVCVVLHIIKARKPFTFN